MKAFIQTRLCLIEGCVTVNIALAKGSVLLQRHDLSTEISQSVK